jgi:predicted GIY-YIG superfamily endonuclease
MAEISFAYTNPLRSRLGDEFFKNIPEQPGVYFFLNEKRQPLYIGKADNLRRRLMSYKSLKPGQAAEHTLEMLEHTEELRWELHESGDQALQRESALIRAIRPSFNIAGTEPLQFLYCGIRPEKRPSSSNLVAVDFRLSHHEIGEGFTSFGCFPHRGKTKAGYSALLRLFYAATCGRERFHLPAKLCRTSPAYVHRGSVPSSWIEPLRTFLRGEDPQLLHLITHELLERENLPVYLYAPLQRDLHGAHQFFLSGPSQIRELIKKEKLKTSLIRQPRMEKILAKNVGRDALVGTLTAPGEETRRRV